MFQSMLLVGINSGKSSGLYGQVAFPALQTMNTQKDTADLTGSWCDYDHKVLWL